MIAVRLRHACGHALCAEPGRLLKLASGDLQWLIDTEPSVKAKIAATLAERLQQR